MGGEPISEIRLTTSLALNREQTGAIIGISGKYIGTFFRIRPRKRILIGRDYNQVDFVLDEDSISRMHCWIEYDDTLGKYLFCDCSKNGVTLNHQRRLEKNKITTLSPGDELGFAKTANVFKLG